MTRDARLELLSLGVGVCVALAGAPVHAAEARLNQSTKASIDLTFGFCPQYVAHGDALLARVDPAKRYGLKPDKYSDERSVLGKTFDDGSISMVRGNEPRYCEVQLVSSKDTSTFFNYVGAALTRNGFELKDRGSDDKVRYGKFVGKIEDTPFEFTLAVDHVLPRVKVTVEPG